MIRGTPSAIQTAQIVDTKVNAEIRVDRVTQDSADSFPASDPPSWTPLRVGSPSEGSHRDPAAA
jgi:hypothetical protein